MVKADDKVNATDIHITISIKQPPPDDDRTARLRRHWRSIRDEVLATGRY